MYNRFGRPETLVWLIEALLKESNNQFDLKELINEIENKKPQTACAIIREKMPFDNILELLP